MCGVPPKRKTVQPRTAKKNTYSGNCRCDENLPIQGYWRPNVELKDDTSDGTHDVTTEEIPASTDVSCVMNT